jgi:uncharacterized protein
VNVVVDTNVLVSGIFWSGKPGTVLERWRDDEFVLVATAEILTEYLRVLDAFASEQPELVEEWSDFLLRNARIVERTKRLKMCRDPHDDMFLECAVSCEAECIVSGDKDLLSMSSIDDIPIVTASRFLADWFF